MRKTHPLLYLFTRISRHDDGSWSTLLVAFLFRACQGLTQQCEAVDGEERDRYFEKKFIFIPINKTFTGRCVL
jgi:hypothetical protein